MNATIKQMTERGSIRKFSSKPIEKDILDMILKAGIQAPNYINGQQYSIIEVQNEKKRELLFDITIGSSGAGMTFIKKAPVFLLFVMDFNKSKKILEKENEEMFIQNSMEALLIGGVDIGILIEAITVASESLGLGTVTVGAIRKNTKALIDAFNLPKYTFPVCGLALGYLHEEAKVKLTPRLPLEATLSIDEYDSSKFDSVIDSYNEEMEKIYTSRGAKTSWYKLVTNYFKKAVRKEQIDDYKNQGFNI